MSSLYNCSFEQVLRECTNVYTSYFVLLITHHAGWIAFAAALLVVTVSFLSTEMALVTCRGAISMMGRSTSLVPDLWNFGGGIDIGRHDIGYHNDDYGSIGKSSKWPIVKRRMSVLTAAAVNPAHGVNGYHVPGGRKQPLGQRKQSVRAFATSHNALPRLPVQPLNVTMTKLLKVLEPVLNVEEHAHCEELVKEFLRHDGPGHQLQQFLEDRAATKENWLSDWWLNCAYLAGRAPLPIVTSPSLSFPKFDWRGQDQQVEFAGLLCSALLEFKQMIDSGSIKQEFAGQAPLDMSQYPLLFGTDRVPGHPTDAIVYGKDLTPSPKHIIVARRGHFFKVPVYDSQGQVLSPAQISQQIFSTLKQSEVEVPLNEQVGLLTTENRSTWAHVRSRLRTNPCNAKSLSDLETCLFLLSLDEPGQASLPDYTEEDVNLQMGLHGGGAHENAGNRWYDKTLQFLVAPHGFAGLTYEHTPAEGPAVAAIMDFTMDKLTKLNFNTQPASGKVTAPEHLEFVLSDSDKASIEAAADSWQRQSDDIELRNFRFGQYGKNFPKSQKLSPDSYLQMAFHLAYYRLHRTYPPTYETGTLRRFHLARTDTIRLPSTESVRFVDRMLQGNTTAARKAEAIRAAVEAHRQYTLMAVHGEGIDRHVLGYKMAASELGMRMPALLRSPYLQRLFQFQVSTSQVPTKHDIGLAFGPSASDCYGICYNPKEKYILFNISSFNHHPGTSAAKFRDALDRSLMDMHKALVESQAAKL